jgi:hypothetical protein
LKAGESVNELVLVYLPLYGSKSGKTTPELLDKAIKLTPQVAKEDTQKKNKLISLILLLTSTFVTDEEQNKILEDNMRILEDNRAVRVLEEMGRKQRDIEIIRNMLQDGDDISKISRITGLSEEQITEIQSNLLVHA